MHDLTGFMPVGECFYCGQTLVVSCKGFNVADIPDVIVCRDCQDINERRLADLEGKTE